MRLVVLGASGNVGSRVVESAVAAGHEVTAFVRDPQKLQSAGIPPETLRKVRVVQGDVIDAQQLRSAMRGQQAAVQAAGYIGRNYEEGRPLQRLVGSAVRAAVECLEGPRRLWVLAGAGVLDVPGRPGVKLVDVPGFPSKYLIHKDHYELLQSEGASLDWSLACPGVMFDAPTGRHPVETARVRVTTEVAPLELPGWSAWLPTALLLPAFATARDQARLQVAGFTAGDDVGYYAFSGSTLLLQVWLTTAFFNLLQSRAPLLLGPS